MKNIEIEEGVKNELAQGLEDIASTIIRIACWIDISSPIYEEPVDMIEVEFTSGDIKTTVIRNSTGGLSLRHTLRIVEEMQEKFRQDFKQKLKLSTRR